MLTWENRSKLPRSHGKRPRRTVVKAVTDFPNASSEASLAWLTSTIDSSQIMLGRSLTGEQNGSIEMLRGQPSALECWNTYFSKVTALVSPVPMPSCRLWSISPRQRPVPSSSRENMIINSHCCNLPSGSAAPLGTFLSVKYFCRYVGDDHLLVFMGHKPLISAMASHSSKKRHASPVVLRRFFCGQTHVPLEISFR